MVYDFNLLRRNSVAPKYPPYSSELLEEKIFSYFIEHSSEFLKKERTYIPIFFTNIYVEQQNINIQSYLDVLDPNGKYWVAVQHDDTIRERLPKDTLVFACSKPYRDYNTIPIPLIGSSVPEVLKITYNNSPKEYLASFCGSNTHPIRYKIWQSFGNDVDFYIDAPRGWTDAVSTNNLNNFIEKSYKSKYILCPRGNSVASFRFYEAMQLEAIPVIISDKLWLPWADQLDYSEFSIMIHEKDISNIKDILLSISEEKRLQMLERIKEIYPKYFTLEATCIKLLEYL